VVHLGDRLAFSDATRLVGSERLATPHCGEAVMLHRLSADRAEFKTVEFKQGLNILLAARASEASEEQDVTGRRRSRNGAGKSSIVDLIHFLLGGKPEGALTSAVVAEWIFTLDVDVGSERLRASRSVANLKQVFVRPATAPPYWIGNAQWCQKLGEAWFGLSARRGPGGTSYRQLISYFMRRKRDGGLDNPVRTFRSQSTASSETSLAELFGVDAELVRQLHQTKSALKQTKDAQNALAALDKAAATGSKRADLEAQLEAQIAAVKLGRDRLSD
jgi:uncharacterized protein YydD (DUF2326 family)